MLPVKPSVTIDIDRALADVVALDEADEIELRQVHRAQQLARPRALPRRP